MTKIKIDSKVEMLTNKKLVSNILKFLDNYRDILVDKMKDPKIYSDSYIKRDIRYTRSVFTMIKNSIKTTGI